ncbi:gnat family protein [Fusarium heterosporum]|uniref:Gnat family protein n=1 Tax=Fusarium heterosporum TaxID=42747 RepID=A0A8H5WVQ2_FUSHE|nr:gnat family protein [Fusarium heterosporum]
MSEPAEPPPLAIEVLTQTNEKKAALKLVVDSVAQQQQTASRTIIFHPASLSIFAAVLAIAHYGAGVSKDLSAMLTIYPGVIITYLVAIRYLTSAYIRIAEGTDWLDWLKNDGVEDTIIGARFGEDVIGAVILRLNKSDNVAVIRGWTTRSRYRARGLGGDMLRESVKIAKQALGRDCAVEFAADHANSHMPLYAIFNGPFLARQSNAKKALAAAVKEWQEGKEGPQ